MFTTPQGEGHISALWHRSLISSVFVFAFPKMLFSKNQQKLSLGKMTHCDRCHGELEMKDLVHLFQVWCSLTFPGAKGRSYWFHSTDDASFVLNP